MDLQTFFKVSEIKPTPWAIKNNIAPSVISRYLNGNGMSPQNAARIEEATNGQVNRMELLYPESTQQPEA